LLCFIAHCRGRVGLLQSYGLLFEQLEWFAGALSHEISFCGRGRGPQGSRTRRCPASSNSPSVLSGWEQLRSASAFRSIEGAVYKELPRPIWWRCTGDSDLSRRTAYLTHLHTSFENGESRRTRRLLPFHVCSVPFLRVGRQRGSLQIKQKFEEKCILDPYEYVYVIHPVIFYKSTFHCSHSLDEVLVLFVQM
jgi:hypothetical protein